MLKGAKNSLILKNETKFTLFRSLISLFLSLAFTMYVFDFTTVIGLIALAQGGLLALFMMLNYPRLAVSWLIGGLLFTFVIALGHSVFLHSKLALNFPHILGFGPFSTYLIGPIILLITLKLLDPNKKLSRWHLLHFVPFVIHQASRLEKIIRPKEEKLAFLENFYLQGQQTSHNLLTLSELSNLILFYGHRFLYIAISCWLLHQVRVEAKHFTLGRRRLLQIMFAIMVSYCCMWLLYRFTFYIPSLAQSAKSIATSINALALSILTLIIAAFLFKHRLDEIFSNKSTQKYQKNALDDELTTSLATTISEVIVKDKLFSLPDFKQTDLSKETGLSVAMISQVINKAYGLNFNDYLNDYRINYVKELLADPEKSDLDIKSLALEAGFSSKATFYRVFKEKTQLTPSQYRKQSETKV